MIGFDCLGPSLFGNFKFVADIHPILELCQLMLATHIVIQGSRENGWFTVPLKAKNVFPNTTVQMKMV